MRYLLLVHRPAREPPPPPGTPEQRLARHRWRSALRAMAEAGVLVDEAELEPASATITVRVRQGLALFTDGPLAPASDGFDGYVVLECADVEEALRWAAAIPSAAAGGAVEVRPAGRTPTG